MYVEKEQGKIRFSDQVVMHGFIKKRSGIKGRHVDQISSGTG